MKTVIIFILLMVSTIVQASQALHVFVSIPPQKYLVEQVGGDNVRVSVMVKAGHSPATYEPTPKQMARLSDAQLYFQIGVPFENGWITKINQLNEELSVVECCEELVTRHLSHHHSEHDQAGHLDPHIWTSPIKTRQLVELIKEALITKDPANKDEYENNYQQFMDSLDELDKEIRLQLEHLNQRYLLVSHPSWGYFAEDYGLKQIAIEQWGRELQAKGLTELIEFAKANGIRAVYVQKQFNTASANLIAKEIDGRIIELDPLAENVIQNIRLVTKAIVRGAE